MGRTVVMITYNISFSPPDHLQVHHGQHMTMFAFFWFASVFELMYFYGAPVPPSALPPHLDLAAGALAFAVEGVLFLWHLDGRNKLDVQASCK